MANVLTECFANDAAATTLSGNGGSITSGATTFVVANGTNLNAAIVSSGQIRVRIGSELILLSACGSGANATATVASSGRGIEGTAAASHNDGDTVTAVVTVAALQRWMPEYFTQPRLLKYLLMTADPYGSPGSTAPTTLVPNLTKVYIPETMTITNLVMCVAVTAGAGLVAGSNRMGVYNSSGSLLAQTADITAWAGAALKTVALSAAQTITGGPGVFVWLAALISATTMPTMCRNNAISTSIPAAFMNGSLAASDGYRCGTLAAVTSGNSLPASFNPSTDLTAAVNSYWFAAT